MGDVKPSGKRFSPEPSAEVEPDPLLMDEVEDGMPTVPEIAALSRPGYTRSFGGMHFADEDRGVHAQQTTAYKPNNETVRLPASETAPVECGWAAQGPRIVSHQGQGGMQMAGNTKSSTRPKPAYSRNDLGGFCTS